MKPTPTPTRTSRAFWEQCHTSQVLTIQRCEACDHTIFYPRQACTRCGCRTLLPLPACGNGTVYSYTIVSQAPSEPFAGDVPYVVALVDLNEGPRLMTNIVDVDPADVEIGMRVRLTFEQRGPDVHVPQFTPA